MFIVRRLGKNLRVWIEVFASHELEDCHDYINARKGDGWTYLLV